MASYEVLEQIGEGGMAVVHRARQRLAGFDRIVAIKQMKPLLADRAEIRARFALEARIVSALAHANIVQVYDASDQYIAMEYLEGWSLLRVVAAAGAAGIELPLGVVLSLLHELCDALAHVHTRRGSDGEPLGIVHRDLSLGNVFVTRSGHLKLIDFGVATAPGLAPDDGRICGKPSYMAPEVIRGRASDARADVFAIGVIAWELLAGRRLFLGPDDQATTREVLFAGPVPPATYRDGSPPMLDGLVLEALEKSPDKRTASAALLRDRLEIVMRACEVEVRSSLVAKWMVETGLDAQLAGARDRDGERDGDREDEIGPDEGLREPATMPDAPPRERRTETPLAWEAPVARGAPAWKLPPLRVRAPVAWSRAVMLAVLIVGGPVALVALGRPTAGSGPAPAPVVMMRSASSLPSPPTPPAPPHEIAPALMAPGAADPAREDPAHVDPPARRTRDDAATRASARIGGPRVAAIIPEVVAPAPASVAVAVAAVEIRAPISELPAVAPRAVGPAMIPPNEVHRLSGEIGRIDGRRIERDGGPKQLSALLCIDAQGKVSSVKLLVRTPAWLGELVERDLRAFTFTPSAKGAACFVRQLAID